MKNTLDAIKYGLETLNVSPKELFSLIESSNGYTGDSYKRWLANEIIKLAEKDGVGYSHLLAKWFNLIQGIIEEYSDGSLKSVFANKISELLGTDSKVYTIGFNEESVFGEDISDIDWFNGVDLPYNYDFMDTLPELIKDGIIEGNVTFLMKSNPQNTFKKSSTLLLDAKSNRIPIKNADALMLYRMCAMARVLEGEENFSFVFMLDTEFLFDVENAPLIDYLLSYFKYEGFVVSSKDLYEGSFTSEEYAICKCTFRSDKDVKQEGFKLSKAVDVNGVVKLSSKSKRYSQGGDMLSSLYSEYNNSLYEDNVPLISRDYKVVGKTKGMKKAYGYLCKGSSDRNALLYSYPVEGTDYIAITKDNIELLIAYYGVSVSKEGTGLFSSIPEIIDGHPEYKSLVSNCLPLFLFDVNTKFCDMGNFETKNGKVVHLGNKFSISSDLVHSLIDKYSVYFSYEAKELMDVCFGLVDYFNQHSKNDIKGITFEALRKDCEDVELNKSYISALSRCKDYISSTYNQMYS